MRSGCALAIAQIRAFQSIDPEALPRLEEATVDWRVLLFGALAAGLCGLIF